MKKGVKPVAKKGVKKVDTTKPKKPVVKKEEVKEEKKEEKKVVAKPKPVEESKIKDRDPAEDTLFLKYATDGLIRDDGIEKLCEDLGISIEAVEVLGLMFICECRNYGEITATEFIKLKPFGKEKICEVVKETSKDY